MVSEREPKPTLAIQRQQPDQSMTDDVQKRPVSLVAVVLVLGLFAALFFEIVN